MKRAVGLSVFLSLGLCFLAGCAGSGTPRHASPYVPATEQGVVTAGLDEKDYQLATSAIAREMMRRGLPKGFVVTLGPVDTRETPYKVDIERLQDQLESILGQEGTLRFAVLRKGMRGNDAFDELYKVLELNWYHRRPDDPADLQKFARMANINGMLYGRVSAIERPLPKGGIEITYTFTWRLADLESGEVIIPAVMESIRKNVRASR